MDVPDFSPLCPHSCWSASPVNLVVRIKMKVLWLTDIHLEFLDELGFSNFIRDLCNKNADAILISGDIAQASTVGDYLSRMAHLPLETTFREWLKRLRFRCILSSGTMTTIMVRFLA